MISAGTVIYNLGTPPVTGTGLSWSLPEMEEAVTGPVASVVYDDVGTLALAALFGTLAETGFTSALPLGGRGELAGG